jgi:hypothetical protein
MQAISTCVLCLSGPQSDIQPDKGRQFVDPLRFILVLQCGSGPYPDFVAKILGVDTTISL